jgi:phosphoserine phosphatase
MTASRSSKPAHPKLAAFDMDGTLLSDRVIYTLARKLQFSPRLEAIVRSGGPRYLRSRKVAALLEGLSIAEFLGVVEGMQLTTGASAAVESLRSSGYLVGIISDSYTLATGTVARKLMMDFHVANKLVVKGDVITGELEMPMGWEKIGCTCEQSVCKRYQLVSVAKVNNVEMRNTAAIGDSESDACMIESAGTGIWFNPAQDIRTGRGQLRVDERDLGLVSRLLTGWDRTRSA